MTNISQTLTAGNSEAQNPAPPAIRQINPQEAAPTTRRFVSPHDALRRLVDNNRKCYQ